MASRIQKQYLQGAIAAFMAAAALVTSAHVYATSSSEEMRFIQVAASSKEERSAIANTGMSIEATRSDSVWGFANQNSIRRLEAQGFKILGDYDYKTGRGGHDNMFDFPVADARFHNYDELTAELRNIEKNHPDIAKVQSIGKTVEGRDIWAIHLNSSESDLEESSSDKPGTIFMGAHHAREHLSSEVPLMLAQYLVEHRRAPNISRMLDSRDIWIIPLVNPDGSEYDIAKDRYRYWRKNRRKNGNGTYGVDLNRNYGFNWGTGGSDKDPSSDIYMGPEPFSEPETRAIRDFVDAHANARTLLTFHTYSELILYPWGNTYDPVANSRDRAVFAKMATTMARWNGYTPEQSSSLYITSGDTTDWAYGTHGIFAFTFEMSPANLWDGGFYPGAGVIDKVFNDNLKPALYLIDVADNPYKVLGNEPTGFLRHYVEPRVDYEWMWQ